MVPFLVGVVGAIMFSCDFLCRFLPKAFLKVLHRFGFVASLLLLELKFKDKNQYKMAHVYKNNNNCFLLWMFILAFLYHIGMIQIIICDLNLW